MRRDGFDPVAELTRIRTEEGVRELETAMGAKAYLVTRYADVREVLGDAHPVQQRRGVLATRGHPHRSRARSATGPATCWPSIRPSTAGCAGC